MKKGIDRSRIQDRHDKGCRRYDCQANTLALRTYMIAVQQASRTQVNGETQSNCSPCIAGYDTVVIGTRHVHEHAAQENATILQKAQIRASELQTHILYLRNRQ